MSRVFLIIYTLCVGILLLANERRVVLAEEAARPPFPADLLKRHMEFPGCIDPADQTMPKGDLGFTVRLDESTELYGILCETAAYNWPYAIYIVRDGYYFDAERVLFADYAIETGWIGSNLLYNASFDAATRQLRGFAKARGLGDCGSQTALEWDGNQFNLMEFRYKQECDENVDQPFPLIYKRHRQ